MIVTQDMFLEATGRVPVQDDLERCNCDMAGELGHYFCGWCADHNKPVFECGCIQSATRYDRDGIG